MADLSIRPSTHRVYTNSLKFILQEVGHARVDRLTPLALSTAFSKLLREGRGPRQLQLGHGYLKGCLDWAVKLEIVNENPMAKVRRPKWEPRNRKYWSVEELCKFLDATDNSQSHWGPLFAFLATSGLRISEALGLTWADVDLSLHTVRVERSLVWVGGEYSIGPLKTAAGRRTVSLTESALRAISRFRDAEPVDLDRHVFRSIHGNPPRHDQLHKPLTLLCREAGVPRINVHGLRHVAAGLAFRATGDPHAVQQRLGHAHVSVTMGIYSYATRSDHDVAASLDQLLTSTDPQ